jgi:3-oxoacyl-(acyl-carrier-protein) synthase
LTRRRRVVVTGLGVVSALGGDVPTFFRRCLAGETAVAPVPAGWLEHSALKSRIWSPLGAWERPSRWIGRLEARQLDPAARLALLAAEEAVGSAGLAAAPADPKRNTYRVTGVTAERAGIFLGTGAGGLNSCLESASYVMLQTAKERLAALQRELQEERPAAAAELGQVLGLLPSPRALSPFSVTMTMPNGAASHLSIKLGWTGPCRTYGAACASGTMALGRAFRAIAGGECDLALAGGTEYLSDPYGCSFRGFDLLGALVRSGLPPERANRPFDRGRSGFLFSEGAAALLVLEERRRAYERGAAILAEVAGYGETTDAHSILAMSPDGKEIRRALEACLADADLAPGEVGYVNAHGTGTAANDEVEARVLEEVFPAGVPVSSTKSLLGHTLGASGAVEALVTVLTLVHRRAHPSRNLEDPISSLPFVTIDTPLEVTAAVTQSFAFGGQNAVLAFCQG